MEVIKAKEMARVEKLAFEEGASSDAFMQKAALGIADQIDHYISKHHLEKKVCFVAGKGNNGGDAFSAALFLLKKGYKIKGYHLEELDSCSSLCQKYGKEFLKESAQLVKIDQADQIELPKSGILLDGILGTGFEGEPTPFLKELFNHLNQVKVPLFAIDIPSGLNGNTGEVLGSAIQASHTIFLGCPKKGFFIQEGWNYVGKLIYVDFGLDLKYIDQAKAEFELLQDSDIEQLFPKIVRSRHKYEAGYVVGITGSKGMMGASILSGMAALKSGAGMVKVIHLEDEFTDTSSNPELIHKTYAFDQVTEVLELMSKSTAVYLGPGMGISEKSKAFLKELLPQINKPCVLDADALTIIAEEKLDFPKDTVITPHMGEMHRLLAQKPEDSAQLFELCQEYVDQHSITLLLKGGPSFIFRKGHLSLVNPTGDPGMATAGSGDVLTGMVAGFLSQEDMDTEKATQLGVYLHGKVGEVVAKKKSSYGMTASDLLKFLYKVLPRKKY